jgi:tetratricopeptide (TPR) repeat protein
MIAIVASLILATVDPCAPIEPAPARDPVGAAAYREVGDAERSAGSTRTAMLAYRAAVARDPSDASSRRALSQLCSESSHDAFQRGVSRMDAGDLRGAIAALREARAQGPEPSAALVEGVCHYELGEDAEARAALREAATASAHRQAADFYLGLIALREGEGGEAARLLDSAATNPGFAPVASELARLARRSGKLVFSILAESGWDSNAQLAPGGTPISTSSDGSLSGTVMGLYRPQGESGPYLRATGLYRGQVRFSDLDFGGVSGATGWQLGHADRGLLAEYDYDHRLLGGSSFLSAHRLLVGGWVPAGPFTFGASYLARFESYSAIGDTDYTPFSGTLQRADATVALRLGRSGRLTLGYHVARDGVEQTQLSWTEHGPGTELRFALARRLRVGVNAVVSRREYDALDASLGLTRSDTYVDVAALLEWDVGDRFTLRFSVDGRSASSNAAAFDYTRVAPTLGLAYVFGM